MEICIEGREWRRTEENGGRGGETRREGGREKRGVERIEESSVK